VAVLTNDPAVRGLGVDTEPISPLPPELAEVILRGDESGLDARLAFVLKEAAYKAWSSLGGRLLGHLDVRVQTDGGHFIAAVVEDDVVIEGRFEAVRGRWLAVAVVPSDAAVVGAT
jgi:4'-phosphopantetheinyl transferase EntD